MALEGSLKEFNVADILQLIFFQKKTGVLMLNGRYDRVRVLFSDGNIVGGESRKRAFERKLGNVLMKRGVLSKEQIESTIAKQRTEGGKFGAMLVKEGHITKDLLQEILSFQISEVMVQVFSMKEGFYEFKPQAVPVDKEYGVELNTEHYLMEGVRILDEWTEIEGKIKLDDVFYRQDPAPNVSLDEKEQRVLDFVDGQHSVADVTDISGIDSFTVSSNMLELVNKGMVMLHVEEEPEPAEVKPGRKTIPGLKAIIYLLVLISIGMAANTMKAPGSDDLDLFRASEQLDALRLRIETEYYVNGRYPTPVELDAVDPWGNLFLYEVRGDGYLLMSAGKDGLLATVDDLPPIYGYFSK